MSDTSTMPEYVGPCFDSNGNMFDPRVVAPPTDAKPYPHSTECVTPDTVPAWELLDRDTRVWRRGPCGGHRTCTSVQYHDPRAAVPAPPQPSDDNPELIEYRAEHGRLHVEVELDTPTGDTFGHWVARCDHPGHAPHRWRHQAAVWYREHGVDIAPRLATGPMTLDDIHY